MKRKVVSFKRTPAGEWIAVSELRFLDRLRGLKSSATSGWYWRPVKEWRTPGGFMMRESRLWAPVLTTPSLDHTPLTGPCVSYRTDVKLGRALREWQATQPVLSPYAHFFECECGRQHPQGFICVSSIGGRS